ncbi:MAG: hypothetical protein AB7O56_09535 [Bauldia sp.]
MGTWVNIVQTGVGTTKVQADTGVTLNGAAAGDGDIAAQWGGVTIQKAGTNAWVMVGLHGVVS